MNTAGTRNYFKRLNWSVQQISVLLTVIALLLWSHSILYARFEVGYFGLIHGLPITFFVSLAFLTAASATLWTSAEGHGKLLCLQLLILISALWLVPAITGGSPTFNDHAYRSLGFIDYIGGQGHFSSREISYLSWPGVFILSTTLDKVLSVDFKPVLDFFPFFMQLLYLLPLYVFLKNTLGQDRSNYCWAGAWLFSLANWQGNEYFSSSSGTGLFFLLLILALVTVPSIWERGTRNFTLLFFMVCIFAALAITHLLTTLAAVGIMAALTLVKKSKRMALVMAVCFVLLIAWSLTGAAGHTKYTIAELDVMLPGITVEKAEPKTMEIPGETIEVPTPPIKMPSETTEVPTPPIKMPGETIEVPTESLELPAGRTITFAPNVIVKREILVHVSGSESHIAVTKTRILFSAMFAMIGIIGAVVACLTKRRRDVAISILAMALAPLILIVIPYGGRLVSYLFVFSLAPMAYFGARLLDIRRGMIALVAFCLFLVVSLPLHVIAHYGNQAFEYFPQTQDSGLRFSYAQPNNDKLITLDPLYRWAVETEISGVDYPFFSITKELQWQGRMVLPKGKKWQGSPGWIHIMRRDEKGSDFILGDSTFIQKVEGALADSVNCHLVYRNPDFKLYRLEPVVLLQK